MKFKFLLLLGVCITLLTQYSCSNEVEVIGVWKDIPVVYGVIHRPDSVNYIRIERAYLPPNESALDVAKNPDSLYFDTSDVKITMNYISQAGDTLIWPGVFERVSLADEGITREDGIFANNPAYVYKITGKTNFDFLLKIDNKKTGNVFYARTEQAVSGNYLFGPEILLLMTPSYSLVPYKPLAWRTVNQSGQEVFENVSIDMTLRNGVAGFAAIYDYKFRFYYKEYEVDNNGNTIAGSEVDKSIEWRAVSDFIPPSPAQAKQTINGEVFYQFLEANLSDVTGSNTRRCAGYMELYIDGATSSLKKYIEARQANEGFVGGLYPADPYSNVSGGFGVLATSDRLERPDRASDPRLMELSNLTREYLRERTLSVKNIGFVSETPCY